MTQQDEELLQIKSKIQNHLISSGNYDKINKSLKLQLIEQGWYDKLNTMCLNELNDNDDCNFNDLYNKVKPKAHELVPENVKQDILNKIKEYLDDVIQ